MKKPLAALTSFFIITVIAYGQTVTTNPAIPNPSQPVTITFDVTGTAFNLNDAWLWAWLENGATDVNAPTNVNPATDAQSAARVTRSTTNPNLYSITLTATTFFNKPASEIRNVGVLLKGRDWSNGQTSDKFITFSESFSVGFSQPSKSLFFVNNGESIPVSVTTNQPASIVLKIGAATIASSVADATVLNYEHVVNESTGSVTVVAEATKGTETKTASFTYLVRTPAQSAPRPAGIIDGINYASDPTKATLSLWAPGKTSVYVLGDFNDWAISATYQMKKDGEHFWLEVTGLTAGTEYAFQYLVDETLKIADPYADKILDPDDQHIAAGIYPNLKTFPSKARSDQWYYNRVAVLQTAQVPFAWQATGFQKPAKEKLVIYELLIRDFFANGERSYQNMIDTLSYLKTLGINAIELMPIMEFNGNDSWGYNPTFMFAPDKYYGSKNKLKEFIDKCHEQGIAVILDIAMNHQDIPNPYVMMDFDFSSMRPEPDNKWFNVTARHPFNVFFDMNHESAYTKKYLDTVNHYWLNEYKIDGFRFDLSKGFTQRNNPANVEAWSAYDDSRVALLKRMADKIWQHSPDAYVILEHLSVNSEEKELAEYRAAEGKGMLMWGKMTDPYNQNTMGFAENSDLSWILADSRGWSVPHVVGYMESHDEERLMVKNMLYGNSSGDYTTRDINIAVARMRAASTLFYTLPGPKMLWQFGEFGYDVSINHCPNETINPDCRVSAKPLRWQYLEHSHRRWLYDHIRDLNKLRSTHPVFTSGTATFEAGNSLVKQVVLKNNPYSPTPSGPQNMNAVAVVNFDVTEKNAVVSFPHAGTWYDYYRFGEPVTVSAGTLTMQLAAGEYRIFTDIQVQSTVVTDVVEATGEGLSIYPNPAGETITLQAGPISSMTDLRIWNLNGVRVPTIKVSDDTWDVSQLTPGVYVGEVRDGDRFKGRVKILIR